MTDVELLERHRGGSHDAFTELVRRHIDWVWSVPRRRVRDAHLAEDVAQASFAVLFQKPPRLKAGQALSLWLFTVVNHAALQVLRTESRRRHRETEAVKMKGQIDSGESSQWVELEPHLDELVGRLDAEDRQAVLLRFYEKKSFTEVGETMGISEEAARKRITRAIEKLRGMFEAKGIRISAGALGGMLLSGASATAPVALAATISSGAVGSSAVASGVIAIMAMGKLKTSVAVLVAAVLLMTASVGIVLPLVQKYRTVAAPAAAPLAPITGPWRNALAEPWEIMEQVNAPGLLHGMPTRLRIAMRKEPADGPLWRGVEGGGRLRLKVLVDGEAQGEVMIGFFTDPRWNAAPVQVRKVPGAGEHLLENLPPGKYQIGAIIGEDVSPKAVGIHRRWPAPIEIQADGTAEAELRISDRFEKSMGTRTVSEHWPNWAGEWPAISEPPPLTIKTVASDGSPLPFCRVVLMVAPEGRPMQRYGSFKEFGTDEQGNAYINIPNADISVLSATQFESLPEHMGHRSRIQQGDKVVRGPSDRSVVTLKFAPVPSGSTRLSGRVRDQFDRPLQGFFISLSLLDLSIEEGTQLRAWSTIAVRNDQGRFEIDGVAPGQYRIQISPFDVEAFDYLHQGPPRSTPPLIIAEGQAHAQIDLRIEAKDRYYGKAVYTDGIPVYPGSWTAVLSQPERGEQPETFSRSFKPDGSFSVDLSAARRGALLQFSEGKVELYDQTGQVIIRVPISELSKDPNRPNIVPIPRVGVQF